MGILIRNLSQVKQTSNISCPYNTDTYKVKVQRQSWQGRTTPPCFSAMPSGPWRLPSPFPLVFLSPPLLSSGRGGQWTAGVLCRLAICIPAVSCPRPPARWWWREGSCWLLTRKQAMERLHMILPSHQPSSP